MEQQWQARMAGKDPATVAKMNAKLAQWEAQQRQKYAAWEAKMRQKIAQLLQPALVGAGDD